ncbi:MAG: hypothetical protein Q9165_006508 [Trypethelium subeluteriae]
MPASTHQFELNAMDSLKKNLRLVSNAEPIAFDRTSKYVAKEPGKGFFNDGREQDLLKYVLAHPSLPDMRGSPEAVIAAIDEYGRTTKFLMNIGSHKGDIVTEVITTCRPEIVVEVGGYVGYSAILFGNVVRRVGGKKYISIEENPSFAAISTKLIELAGLEDIVTVIVGPSDTILRHLHETKAVRTIDLLFLDHLKPLYTRDLRHCENFGMIRPGTTLVADDVIQPGNPQYLAYVRATSLEKKARVKAGILNGEEVGGDPTLIYESKMIHTFHMSGVPVGAPWTYLIAEILTY